MTLLASLQPIQQPRVSMWIHFVQIVSSIIMPSTVDKLIKFLNYWWFRYLMVTELYIVEKWERVVIRTYFFQQQHASQILWMMYIVNNIFRYHTFDVLHDVLVFQRERHSPVDQQISNTIRIYLYCWRCQRRVAATKTIYSRRRKKAFSEVLKWEETMSRGRSIHCTNKALKI